MHRTFVCLVVDESTADRIPTALRYLQVGLIDDGMSPILIVPEQSRCAELSAGPTTVLSYRPDGWLHLGRDSTALESVISQLASLKLESPPVIHAMGPGELKMASSLSARIEGQLLMSAWSTDDLTVLRSLRNTESPRAIVVPSETIGDAIPHEGTSDCKVHVVPIGVSQKDPVANSDDTAQSPTLVFAGPILAHTGLISVLRAVRRVIESYPWLLLFVIGKGAGESLVRDAANELGIGENVVITGRIEYLRDVLTEGHVFCMPDWESGYREELIHAMNSGMAIIAATGGPYDGLVNNESALLHDLGDEDGVTEKLVSVLSNSAERRRLGRGARAVSLGRHTVTKMVEGYSGIYRELSHRGQTLSIKSREGK